MIKQIHLNQCDSTQDVLKEQSIDPQGWEHILVSCETQIKGRGRGDNLWEAMPGTLCFSLNLQPHAIISFTALEISLLVVRFFEQKGKSLRLKWPNDIWTEEGKKCGGVLIQGHQHNFFAGVGINLSSNDQKYGGVYQGELEIDKKIYAHELAAYILNNRYNNSLTLKEDWLQRCGHLNQPVVVDEGNEVMQGIFSGLGDYGEGLLLQDSETRRVFNGSLRLT